MGMRHGGRLGYWFARFGSVAFHTDTRAVEFFFCLLKLSWGIFLLLPFASLGTGLHVFGYLVPEGAVGTWFTFLGAWQLAALVTLSLPARTVATVLGLLTWSILAASIGVANPRSVLWVLMTVLAVTNLWVHIRLRVRAP